MLKKFSFLLFVVFVLAACQRQPSVVTPSPAPTVSAPTPSIEPALLDDGLDDALKELDAVE